MATANWQLGIEEYRARIAAIANLTWWLRADQVARDAAAATVGRMSAMFDQASGLRHATQATAGNQPLQKGGQRNGRPSAAFTSSRQDRMAVAPTLGVNYNARIYCVLNNLGKTGEAYLTYGTGVSGDSAGILKLGSTGNNNVPSVSNRYYSGAVTGWHIYGFGWTNTSFFTFVDGGADVSTAGTPDLGTAVNTITLASPNTIDADIAEIIWTQGVLQMSAADDALIREYLRTAYALY